MGGRAVEDQGPQLNYVSVDSFQFCADVYGMSIGRQTSVAMGILHGHTLAHFKGKVEL